jgi:hypothetical protein
VVDYWILGLKAPTNIEKKVTELQTSLYRDWELASALTLPVMIPISFLPPGPASQEPEALRSALRGIVGKQAPYFRSASIIVVEGCLFWDLEPREQLQRLAARCSEGFPRGESQQEPLFPVGRGFYLGSVEGRSGSGIASIPAPEPLSFPARAAVLMRIHPLVGDIQETAQGMEQDRAATQMWWQSLFWEELVRLPLRKGEKLKQDDTADLSPPDPGCP